MLARDRVFFLLKSKGEQFFYKVQTPENILIILYVAEIVYFRCGIIQYICVLNYTCAVVVAVADIKINELNIFQ